MSNLFLCRLDRVGRLIVVSLTLAGSWRCPLPCYAALANVAPNASFEMDARRLGGWVPLGLVVTNEPDRVFITNGIHRQGQRALCVQPGPEGIRQGRFLVAGYNGGEDEHWGWITNGVRGARTIGLRLDPDVCSVSASVWVRGADNARITLSLVWTGRRERHPADLLHMDSSTQLRREEAGWRLYELTATRPLESHQVQLWLESDATTMFYLDDVEMRMERARGAKVLVDQLGYEPESETKMAVLQADSPLPALPAARVIELRRYRTVYSGPWRPCPSPADWDRVYWTFDFSSLTNEGRYCVVAGEGRNAISSAVFDIQKDLLLQHAAEPGYRFFFYQRCGTEVPGFHAACHLDDARMPDGTHRDFSGGWHDAGDYNKYCGFTPESVYALAVAHHRRPQLFAQWDQDHNKRADIMDETAWGAEFLAKALDRGSFELIVNTISTGYRYWGEPEKETDNQPGNSDDRPVRQRGGDRTWCSAGLALAGSGLKRAGDRARGEQWIELAVKLYEKIGGNIETLAALYAATGDAKYRSKAQQEVEGLLNQPRPEDHFRTLGEFAVDFSSDPLVARIKPIAARRVAELEKLCELPFKIARYPIADGMNYFPAYADVNDWYVGSMMRHLDVAIEGAMAFRLGVSAGRRLAEHQVHWILGNNPFGVSMMEDVGSVFLPGYHHRYNTIPGNPRGAVPGALVNGVIRAWPHQDRPWLDFTAQPNADYHSNEPWLPYNNRWMILMSLW